MIKNFKPRLYQQTIFATAVEKNTLVVLPTGMGKTNIFLMLAAQRLKQYPDSKILLLGPTKPLIDQYYSVFKKNFEINEKDMAIFSGKVKPDDREKLWVESKIVFSTPQAMENDIICSRVNLENVSLIGFDEAHKAVGDYAYVWVAKQYHKLSKFPKIIGMTASPGSDLEKIKEVCKNLRIESIEVRTNKDPDVRQYVKPIEIKWVDVELPKEFLNIKKYLDDCIQSKLLRVAKKGFISKKKIKRLPKRELLGLQASLQAKISQGERDYEVMKSISLVAEAMKVQHASILLETQGISPLLDYMNQIKSQSRKTKVKAVINLMRDLNFRSAMIKAESLFEKGIEHPKLSKLREILDKKLKNNQNIKLIIFTQYRDSAVKIKEEVDTVNGVKSHLFTGQQKKRNTGMSQKKQKQVLEDFKAREYNILIATQIAEEGLDIPKVDSVIFYEPIPSAIRFIQRKGRTGRQEEGEVIVLTTKKTRDEAYKWAAIHKERRMYRVLNKLKKDLQFEVPKKSLKDYIPKQENITVYVDHREKGSGTIKQLIEWNIKIQLESLDVADYVLSKDVCVELKTVEDFVNSIIDGRLLAQLRSMKKSYKKPIVLVEGNQDIYSVRRVHPNAILGLLSTIIVDYSIPIVYTKNPKETAAFLRIVAKREQVERSKDVYRHGEKKPLTQKELQEFIVSSLPGVGATLSKPLLNHFKSIKNIANASIDELKKVNQIGKKKAKAIKDIIDAEYGK
ncbi:MAG: 3'-flap repair endonuclease Xpf [Candidatus Woesearchaeota archaeon]|nr:3'-flap repair endonuclease Xpf [Candidatus Woesearchaeota archaeon]